MARGNQGVLHERLNVFRQWNEAVAALRRIAGIGLEKEGEVFRQTQCTVGVRASGQGYGKILGQLITTGAAFDFRRLCRVEVKERVIGESSLEGYGISLVVINALLEEGSKGARRDLVVGV
jgi:hypothetical protein